MKIKKGDMVVVTVGQGSSSSPHRVTEVQADGKRLVVEGVNMVYKHVKRGHPKSPQGGRLRREMSISSSNVMYYCAQCNKPVRLGYRYTADGAKERHCRNCKASAGVVSPARAAHAKKA